MKLSWTLNSFLSLIWLFLRSTNAITYKETLGMGQSLGTSDTLVSANGNFELGFFTRGNSTKYYVGMRFKKVPKDNIVWVANRELAASDSNAVLTVTDDGNLAVKNDRMVYFVTNISDISNTHVMLLDSGNLLLMNNSNLNILWQSFHNPTNTLLPGMTVRSDEGTSWSLTSWTSVEDPSPGNFSLEVDKSMGSARLIIRRESEIYWIGDEQSNFTFQSIGNRTSAIWDTGYLTWQGDYTSRLVLEVSGELNQQFWSQNTMRWVSLLSSKCGRNAICGNFGICNPQATDPCECLQGFEPYDEDSWKKGDTSAGCRRKTELCSNTSSDGLDDGFLLVDGVDFSLDSPLAFKTQNAFTCQRDCSINCSCVAYAYDVTGSCLFWLDRVLNLKNISVDYGDDNYRPSFYLKLARSDLINNELINNPDHNSSLSQKALLTIVILIIFLVMLALALFAYYCRRRKLRREGEDLLMFDTGMSMKVEISELTDGDNVGKVNKRDVKLPLFSFASVSAATNKFSPENKLGEGGFGPVYKGKLLNGGEVAVKRLSARSGQGWEELKNEAMLIAKLQHNNLVRLLGCCVERDEKMLIYEFMPNKSLDVFLFDATKCRILDWETRVRIIDGIAQGLLYLHQYSRFRIIHRDLKASNILLDIDMNPKISDFGLARLFGGNELQANTNRIVGTYGYMSPEYALEGIFSIKSDVFSFGVLLLEIISGKKNTGLYHTNSLNLLGYAWDLWTSGRGTELMDSASEDASVQKIVVRRYVNIALLCVQESAEDRPTMSDVVSMLGNENIVLPYPKPIAFLNVRGIRTSRSDGSSAETVSTNNMTASVMEAR
ncbi:G-type lectin S-receptor-like serine/threonine-protein kinase At4g03230 [Neltuma alba]|uniref:G-type lectin S-receptor-like serine/threonine-protein kinase At4g03230 n=1 Tax=Neltuma alba TaxID=207710 RepID=UPI0010A334BF|nr:G-type lectin S-receptor-like serine/threonine-protein kinase At4g03230 [Prosopis alba]XP_028795115.1 G-type lectin S-receptor-like serine/threonine-protein kinase At4g03230 [Prosopis alba]